MCTDAFRCAQTLSDVHKCFPLVQVRLGVTACRWMVSSTVLRQPNDVLRAMHSYAVIVTRYRVVCVLICCRVSMHAQYLPSESEGISTSVGSLRTEA